MDGWNTGILVSFWDRPVAGAMLVSGAVYFNYPDIFHHMTDTHAALGWRTLACMGSIPIGRPMGFCMGFTP